MARKNRNRTPAAPTPFELARDELFQHIIRCGVIGAAPEHQAEWFADTMEYLRDRYPELDDRWDLDAWSAVQRALGDVPVVAVDTSMMIGSGGAIHCSALGVFTR